MQKLYDKIVGTSSATMPEAPAQPEDGNEDTASKDYADYIIKLAGDEWDAEKGTWLPPTVCTRRRLPARSSRLIPLRMARR